MKLLFESQPPYTQSISINSMYNEIISPVPNVIISHQVIFSRYNDFKFPVIIVVNVWHHTVDSVALSPFGHFSKTLVMLRTLNWTICQVQGIWSTLRYPVCPLFGPAEFEFRQTLFRYHQKVICPVPSLYIPPSTITSRQILKNG